MAERARTLGVMSQEAHRVFASARGQLEPLIGSHQTINAEQRKQFDSKIAGLEDRWQDKVIAACRKMLDKNISCD